MRGGGVVRRKLPKHELITCGSRLTCKHCPQSALTVAAKRRLKSLPCWGPIAHRVAAYARKRGRHEQAIGHLLCISFPVLGIADEAVIWCKICGAYAEKVARNLLRRCPGVPSKAGEAAIARLQGRWHPKQQKRLEEPIPYFPEGRGAGGGESVEVVVGVVRERDLFEEGQEAEESAVQELQDEEYEEPRQATGSAGDGGEVGGQTGGNVETGVQEVYQRPVDEILDLDAEASWLEERQRESIQAAFAEPPEEAWEQGACEHGEVLGGGWPSSTVEAMQAGRRRTTGGRGHLGKGEGAAREDVAGVREADPEGARWGSRQSQKRIGRGVLRENVYSIGGVVIGPEVKEVQTMAVATKRSRFQFGSVLDRF